MSWDRTNQHISFAYMGQFPCSGVITGSRVKYGGRVQHTIKLDKSISVYSAERDIVLVEEDEIRNQGLYMIDIYN